MAKQLPPNEMTLAQVRDAMSCWIPIAVSVLILWAMLYPVFASSRQASRIERSLTAIKHLTEAARAYAWDNEDRFPPQMDSALAARPFIAPYMKGELVERGIEAYRGGHPTDQTILGNFHLAGRRESDLESSADTLVFFEAADWSTGSRFVGFADGRIQSCKGTEVVAAVRSREGVLAPSKT